MPQQAHGGEFANFIIRPRILDVYPLIYVTKVCQLYVVECCLFIFTSSKQKRRLKYEGWNFNSGNYLFTTDTK